MSPMKPRSRTAGWHLGAFVAVVLSAAAAEPVAKPPGAAVALETRPVVLAPAGPSTGAALVIPEKPPPTLSARDEETVQLSPLEVTAKTDAGEGFDGTGMGSYEQQLRDPMFSNDLISADALEDDPVVMEMAGELRQVANPSPVDLATGDSRLSLRGFPTPLLRNGFVTMGALDMLNTSRTITIQGALVPVLGRAAPGGIQDFLTARPSTRPSRRWEYSLSSLQRQSSALEVVGTTRPKKAWHRVAADWSRRTGPERFAMSETRTGSGSVTWRHSAAASTLFALDFQQVHATAAPGIPEYRRATGQKIVGPYRPLAGFNALGPEAGVRRRTAAATVLYDSQPHPKIAVRAGWEAWWRTVEQDRFTTSLYNVATARFEGTREPRHIEQPQYATLGHLEVIGRFSAWKMEHKLMGAVSHTQGEYVREERALSNELRNALPATVRLFRPDAPDYSRPAYTTSAYSRVIADRIEHARYTAIEVSERMGIAKGRLVITSGVRQDFVGLHIEDRRPGVTRPVVKDNVQQATYHLGANYQALPSRLLVFATISNAFEPSTRVDARTGRLQGNEMTRGYEGGVKGRVLNGAVDFSAAAFLLYNDDISRRNPLYDDPIFDANQTQPQLVTSGEERFAGGKVEGRWKPAPPMSVSARVAYASAITTASPDIPEEVGRQMTRVPPLTASTSVSYSFSKGRMQGTSLAASWSYVSGFTAQYEDKQRHQLEYPGYGIVGLSASRSLRKGKFTHSFSVSIRNLLDYDFLAKQDRLGSEREFVGSYRLMF